MRPNTRRLQLISLAVSMAAATVLGISIYLSVTALPYLAVSPASDATYGALNACLLTTTRERLGFAVSADATRASTWTKEALVECVTTDAGTSARRFEGFVHAAAYAHDGTLFTSTPRGIEAHVDGGWVHVGAGAGASDVLVGTDVGVVLYDGAHLTSLTTSGQALGTVPLQLRTPGLQVSSDGQRVVVQLGGGVRVFDTHSMQPVFTGVPCETKLVSWVLGTHQLLVECGGWALELDVDSGRQENASAAPRAGSFLAGPRGPFVEPCDGLPCTSSPPP